MIDFYVFSHHDNATVIGVDDERSMVSIHCEDPNGHVWIAVGSSINSLLQQMSEVCDHWMETGHFDFETRVAIWNALHDVTKVR